jgi:hypothetical protein
MRTTIILAVTLLTTPAFAQRGLGVGAEGTIGSGAITGGGGPTVVYDLENIFIEGGLAFVAGDLVDDAVTLGAACYYKLATTEASDFSLGGGAALLFEETGGPFGGDANLAFSIVLGAKIRAFLVTNVALQVGLGLNILIDDPDEVFLFTSQLAGAAGLVYFF